MIIPKAFTLNESRIIARKAFVSFEELDNQLQTCHREQFTGELSLKFQAIQSSQWSLYFYRGRLMGGTSQVHPIRRWCRQLAQHCPQLFAHATVSGSKAPRYWDYPSLEQMVQQGNIQQTQFADVVAGNLSELLVDLIQTRRQNPYLSGLQLTLRSISEDSLDLALVSLHPDQVWQQAWQIWLTWLQARLESYSPNLAPGIRDPGALRQQTSEQAFQNLIRLVDGDRTIWDLAVKLKQRLVPMAQSLMPYVHQGIIDLTEVGDLTCKLNPHPSPKEANHPVEATPSIPLVAYIEDSQFDSMAMGQILSHTDYRFTNIRDPLQALPILLEQKPGLVFLDLLMPQVNGYEICAQIRKVSALKNLPVIIVTSSDGIIDRVRAKFVGASGFIAKPIETQKVLQTLHQHLPNSQPIRPRGMQADPYRLEDLPYR
jgi:chemotaxis family two-component system response regulator PixG